MKVSFVAMLSRFYDSYTQLFNNFHSFQVLPFGPHMVASTVQGLNKISSSYLPTKLDSKTTDGPEIISLGEEHYASPGERVSLPCRVKDLGTMFRLWKQAGMSKE